MTASTVYTLTILVYADYIHSTTVAFEQSTEVYCGQCGATISLCV